MLCSSCFLQTDRKISVTQLTNFIHFFVAISELDTVFYAHNDQ